MPRRGSKIPRNAVLLIPDPEHGKQARYGVKPGYYTSPQMLRLINRHKADADAIHFIADMLESGDPANDEFANLLRAHHADPGALARIIKAAQA